MTELSQRMQFSDFSDLIFVGCLIFFDWISWLALKCFSDINFLPRGVLYGTHCSSPMRTCKCHRMLLMDCHVFGELWKFSLSWFLYLCTIYLKYGNCIWHVFHNKPKHFNFSFWSLFCMFNIWPTNNSKNTNPIPKKLGRSIKH